MSLFQRPKVLFSLSHRSPASSSGDSGAADIRVGETFFFHRVVRVVYGVGEGSVCKAESREWWERKCNMYLCLQ